jgi:hypothetical protein
MQVPESGGFSGRLVDRDQKQPPCGSCCRVRNGGVTGARGETGQVDTAGLTVVTALQRERC